MKVEGFYHFHGGTGSEAILNYNKSLERLKENLEGSIVKRALLVIDVQEEYFTGALPVTYPANSFSNILAAVDTASEHRVPVILIRHEATQPRATAFARNSRGWAIREELLAKDHLCIVDKKMPGSFTGTGLEEILKNLDVDTLVICGYMTQMCCDTTARQAVHLGFAVEFLSDATGTLTVENEAGKIAAGDLHRAILITQAMRFSQVITTREWTGRLAGRE